MTEPDAYTFKDIANVKQVSLADDLAIDVTQDAIIEGMFSESTIQGLWCDDFKPVLIGEAKELRERGEDDVADQIEHIVKRFEEVFSSE